MTALDGLNVVVVIFDAVSRASWMRRLAASHQYFVDELDGVVMDGFNVVGDGALPALLAMLTGRTAAELPEARRESPGLVRSTVIRGSGGV